MTRLIKYSDIAQMGQFGVYVTKDTFNSDDTLIAQSDKTEVPFEIHSHVTTDFCSGLKSGYIMYILSKKEND